MRGNGADIECCAVSPFPMDSLNSESEPKFIIFKDLFLDLFSPYIRAAKKNEDKKWPASHSLVFGKSVTMDFKPERFILLVKGNMFC